MQSQFTVIITYNLKDFPQSLLTKYQIESLHPDTFLRNQFDLYPGPFLNCVKAVRARLKNPPKTAEEYLFNLYQHIQQTVNILKDYVDLI